MQYQQNRILGSWLWVQIFDRFQFRCHVIRGFSCIEEHIKLFGPLGFLGPLSDDQHVALAQRGGVTKAGMTTLEEHCAKGSWYCGPPEGLIERLQEVGERYPGLDFVSAQSAIGTPETVIVEQLDWFASDVMPAFSG